MDTADPALAAYDLAPSVTVEPLDGGINNATRLVKTGAGDFVWRQYRAQRERDTIVDGGRSLKRSKSCRWIAHSCLPSP